MSFWRQEDPKLNKQGEIVTGGMWHHQRKWWNSLSYIKAMVTGYGGGKTFIGGKRSIALALHNNKVPHLAISPSYKIAKRTIIPTIQELLEGRKIPYTYNKSEFEFIIKHHGRTGIIWIGSGDNPDSLKGPNIGSALIDEPFIQARAVFDQVIARVRHPRARHREIGLTGTPEDLNWGYEICEGDEKGKFDLELIQAGTGANKALDAKYVETMTSAFDDLAKQAYVDGRFVSLNAGQVYRGYDSELNNCKTEINKDGLIYIGMDFNVDPMSAVLAQEHGNELHICEEIILPNSDTTGMVKEILYRYPTSRFAVHPDASGRARSSKGTTDFALLSSGLGEKLESLVYPARNPFLKDRFNCMSAALCNSEGVRRLKVNKSNCPELDKDLRLVSHPYEEYKKKNPKRTHISDACGYLTCKRIPLWEKPTLRVS